MRRVANQPLQYWIDSPIELSQLKQAQASSFPSLLRASIMSWSACLHSKKMQHLGIKYSNWGSGGQFYCDVFQALLLFCNLSSAITNDWHGQPVWLHWLSRLFSQQAGIGVRQKRLMMKLSWNHCNQCNWFPTTCILFCITVSTSVNRPPKINGLELAVSISSMAEQHTTSKAMLEAERPIKRTRW